MGQNRSTLYLFRPEVIGEYQLQHLEIEPQSQGKTLEGKVFIASGKGARRRIAHKADHLVLVEEDIKFPAKLDAEMVAVLGEEIIPLDPKGKLCSNYDIVHIIGEVNFSKAAL